MGPDVDTLTGDTLVPRHSAAAARAWWILPLAGAAGAFVVFQAIAPSYLLHQGFPLDDSWIHAVYARELARSGMLAYNPGVPATGETSPLWALLLAIPYLIAVPGTAIVLTKLLGAALGTIAALAVGRSLLLADPDRPWIAWASGALVALHPHLVAASVSGMEVPLATCVTALFFWAVVARREAMAALLAAAAAGARPETPVMLVAFAFVYHVADSPRRAVRAALTAAAAGALGTAVIALRNWSVSGMPLPATFYVKANHGSVVDLLPQHVGFVNLLGQFPLTNSILVLGLFAVVAVLTAIRRESRGAHAGAAMYLAGVIFCAVSFALVPPIDPAAFYHQRYVLPALLPLVAAMPTLVHALLQRSVPRVATTLTAIFLGVAAILCAAAIPARARHLSNDARNVDDVQVEMGRALAPEDPSRTIWAVDAGAVRFFGRPFVVDMIGLNSPDVIGPSAQSYLDAHPPGFLDAFPEWSRIDSAVALPARTFATTTAYTVTSRTAMRSHVLVVCQPPGTEGRMVIRERSFAFRCAP